MEGLTGRVATIADFDKLTPLLQANCQRLNYAWANYEVAVKQILENPELGVLLMVENGSTAVGFTAFTFEYSDLRDGAFFWMQGL